MTAAILYVFSAIMIFLVLTETVTVKLFSGENYIIEIHFIIFAIVFKKKNYYIKGFRRSKKRRISPKLYPFILTLMKRTDVRINFMRVYIPDRDPDKNAPHFGLYNAIISSFFAFLDNNSKFFTASNITVLYSEHNNLKKQIEAEFKISITDVFIAFFLYIFKECHRLIWRRVIKND